MTSRTENPAPSSWRRRAVRLAGAGLCLGALACGHKRPPLPPPLLHPAPTRDLSIQQRGEELILTFTYPQTTVSGLPLAGLEKVEYWELKKPLPDWSAPAEEGDAETSAKDEGRAEPEPETPAEGTPTAAEAPVSTPDEGPEPAEESGDEEADEESEEDEAPVAPPPPPPTKEQLAAVELLEFVATSQLRLTLEGDELDAATVGDEIVLRVAFTAADREKETAFVYAVKTFADVSQASALSNLATLVRREPPPAPEEFRVEAEAGGVRITWHNEAARDLEESAPEDSPPSAPETTEKEEPIKAYRIYRRDAQARVYGEHIGQVNNQADEYLDRTAQYGNRYIYSLTAVGLYMPLVESALAGESEVDYQDRFAPPAPANPLAFAEPGRIRLLWDASPAPDLAGYLVFRRHSGGAFTRLNAEPIVDLEYNDRDITAGTDYEYRVAAVDRVGNEGDPGPIVKARTP